ncbi:barstar family protein [Vulcaniibacterium tengchongense]|uniref:RNAse (Barnase) inhibitor barstar n=1 Tax=Vulcaniibacterium tengchongense TaxID=1273429 RepID=A0A3N4VKA6_9GAMM|nr:barstar family protein [Vulcaniibacterium tengchongense]RPE80189.1 RNAse (barnase) inhibitor barstar [Vulcaniibacterium tengchongense]
MSAVDLRMLLADARHSGVYFVDARDTEAMAQAAGGLGYAVLRIDLAGCADKAALLRRFAAAGGFPDWFGHNWDALADALADLSWKPAAGYLLLVEHAGDWRAAHGEDFDTLLEILGEAAARWAEADTAFWALLPLPAELLSALEG